MTRDEYNKKIQAFQEYWPEESLRFEQANGMVKFKAYFDRWHTVGIQHHPFQPNAEYEWFEETEIKMWARFSRGITSDRPLPR